MADVTQNAEIATPSGRGAELLQTQRANPFRVQAYRRAARSVRYLTRSLADIWREEGEPGLCAVTGVGERLAVALRILVTTGRLPMIDRLRGRRIA